MPVQTSVPLSAFFFLAMNIRILDIPFHHLSANRYVLLDDFSLNLYDCINCMPLHHLVAEANHFDGTPGESLAARLPIYLPILTVGALPQKTG